MDGTRKLAVVVATVAAAVATGHLMEVSTGTDHPASRLASVQAPERATMTASAPATRIDEIVLAQPRFQEPPQPPAPPEQPRPDRPAPGSQTTPPQALDLAQVPDPVQLDFDVELPRLALSAIDANGDADQPSGETLVTAQADTDSSDTAESEPEIELPELPPVAASPDADTCEPDIFLAAAPAGMIDIAVDAPCNPDTRVVIRHAGLHITAQTTDSGLLDLTIPALAVEAVVSFDIRGGPARSATLNIEEAAEFDRVLLHWQQADHFELHAFEYGASFGEEGHVWAGNPRSPSAAVPAEDEGRDPAGFLTTLGDDSVDWPLMAEIYSFPSGLATREGTVALSIDTRVNDESCGREMLGEALLFIRGGEPELFEITLSMPDCDTTGGFIVLNNLLPNLTIAEN